MSPTATRNAIDAIIIRHAMDADICALHDLAILDSRPPLVGPAMLAEVDGVVRAALSLRDDNVAADPFFRTAELVELLRLHVRSLDANHDSLLARASALVRRPLAARA